MKTRLLIAALVCCLAAPAAFCAASPAKQTEKKASPPKSASEQAYDAFQKVRNVRGAKFDQARFQALIEAGITFLTKHPTSTRANEVASFLGLGYPMSIDSRQPALRAQYVSLLNLELANQKYKEGVKEPVKVALLAVEAAVADMEVRQAPGGGTLTTMREKIDELAETPAGNRFLVDRERSYAQLLGLMKQTARAEEQLNKLSKHSDKAVSDMAKQELNIFAAKKTPFDLKFTSFDGKPVDCAKLRGKAIALYFWSSTNKSSTDLLEKLRQFHSVHRKKGLELVTVSFDKEEDREKLQKFVKEKRFTLPLYYDGKQAKNEFAAKLNVTGVPRLLLFDDAGILQTSMLGTSLSANYSSSLGAFEAEVKRILKIKK